MNKLLLSVVVVAVLAGAGGFYGGMKYAQGRGTRGSFANLTPEQRQQVMANGGGGFRSGTGQGGSLPAGRQGMNGGFTTGEIISKDDKSITIKMGDSGSKIVFYSDTTEINKFIDGAVEDLSIGKNVSVNGTANQDGSLTAQSIQIRPVLTATPGK